MVDLSEATWRRLVLGGHALAAAVLLGVAAAAATQGDYATAVLQGAVGIGTGLVGVYVVRTVFDAED
ncbi:MAG: hypothetical protein ABEJ08_00970 [Halobacteriaceae archaeon]